MIPAFDQLATIGRQIQPQSWFMSSFAWTFVQHVFCIFKSLSGPDFVEFTPTGFRDSPSRPNNEVAQGISGHCVLEWTLKHLRHHMDVPGGKGCHQKWTGPDQRAFILPTRDPVSPGVFKTFLHHVGIDKATYVRQVRPIL